MQLFHIEFGEWSGTPMITPIDWGTCLEYLGDGPSADISQRLLSEGVVNQVKLSKGWVATDVGVNEIVGERVV